MAGMLVIIPKYFHLFVVNFQNSLSIIPDLVVNRLAQKVENEAQLLYFLRIVVPYLQRIHEKERSKHMPEVGLKVLKRI